MAAHLIEESSLLFEQSNQYWRQARQLLAERQAEESVHQAYMACRTAAEAFTKATDVDLISADNPSEASKDSLAVFYRRLSRLDRRLTGERINRLHVEEAANWVRQTRHFIDHLNSLTRKIVDY